MPDAHFLHDTDTRTHAERLNPMVLLSEADEMLRRMDDLERRVVDLEARFELLRAAVERPSEPGDKPADDPPAAA